MKEALLADPFLHCRVGAATVVLGGGDGAWELHRAEQRAERECERACEPKFRRFSNTTTAAGAAAAEAARVVGDFLHCFLRSRRSMCYTMISDVYKCGMKELGAGREGCYGLSWETDFPCLSIL